MITFNTLLKKSVLSLLVLAIGLAAIPAMNASASGLQDDSNPPAGVKPDYARLENAWARLQTAFQRQGSRLDKADELVVRAQNLINRAEAKGWDTSAVQAALDAFASVLPVGRAAHGEGNSIIANHTGFAGNGKVVDRTKALETVKSLAQVLKDTRTALNGTGKALLEAIKTFRIAHRPIPSSSH
jgi:hypothetical protein